MIIHVINKNTIIKTFKTLGKDWAESILKKILTRRLRKKIISNQKVISFKKDKFLFNDRSIMKIIAINKNVRFIKKFPKIKLIGKKAISINKDFSI